MLELILKILALFHRKKINLADYPVRTDYGTLNAYQRNAMDNILSACVDGKDTADIPVMTQAEFDEVAFHVAMHFGDSRYESIALKRLNTAKVNLGLYAEAKANKAELDAWVDNALSKLYEGTTEYKLEQIAKYIARHGEYGYGSNNPLDLVDDGAMCGAYSMLFYKMATRIGVQAYICHGYANNGTQSGFHAWNMADGYFYDVTFYDMGLRSSKYIRSNTAWGREYTVNKK